jgi:hypothetical protein
VKGNENRGDDNEELNINTKKIKWVETWKRRMIG